MEFARQRQGVVIAAAILVVMLLLAGFHQFVMHRNAIAVSDAAAVPLTDVADLGNQDEDAKPLPMPDLQFQYDGNPRTMHTFIVEPGAVTPPDVLAQQQQQQQPPAPPTQPLPQPQKQQAAPAPPPQPQPQK